MQRNCCPEMLWRRGGRGKPVAAQTRRQRLAAGATSGASPIITRLGLGTAGPPVSRIGPRI
jgi:hypothetical protein